MIKIYILCAIVAYLCIDCIHAVDYYEEEYLGDWERQRRFNLTRNRAQPRRNEFRPSSRGELDIRFNTPSEKPSNFNTDSPSQHHQDTGKSKSLPLGVPVAFGTHGFPIHAEDVNKPLDKPGRSGGRRRTKGKGRRRNNQRRTNGKSGRRRYNRRSTKRRSREKASQADWYRKAKKALSYMFKRKPKAENK